MLLGNGLKLGVKSPIGGVDQARPQRKHAVLTGDRPGCLNVHGEVDFRLAHRSPRGRTKGGMLMLRAQCSRDSLRRSSTVVAGFQRKASRAKESKGSTVPFCAVRITRWGRPRAYPSSIKQLLRRPVRSTTAT